MIFGAGARALLEAKDAVIAAKDAEIVRLWNQIESLQRQVLALAGGRAATGAAFQAQPPTGPVPAKRPERIRNVPWLQTAIGGGHVDIHAERQRITGHNPMREVNPRPSGPPKAPGADD